MKNSFLLICFYLIVPTFIYCQDSLHHSQQEIYSLIDQYAQARENRDTVLLKRILTTEVDQLVSSGEWRNGVGEAVQGMLRSSGSNPGTRTLKIEKIRFLNSGSGIVDARYEIQNPDGTTRKMWSTFMVVHQGSMWKIAAIRNMLPAPRNN